MSLLARIVLAFLLLRLAAPPGVCLCRFTAPASALLASVLGRPAPEAGPPHNHHDDHEPGCPASEVSAGLGLVGSPPTLPPADSLLSLLPADSAPLAASGPPVLGSAARPPDEPLFLRLGVLLI